VFDGHQEGVDGLDVNDAVDKVLGKIERAQEASDQRLDYDAADAAHGVARSKSWHAVDVEIVTVLSHPLLDWTSMPNEVDYSMTASYVDAIQEVASAEVDGFAITVAQKAYCEGIIATLTASSMTAYDKLCVLVKSTQAETSAKAAGVVVKLAVLAAAHLAVLAKGMTTPERNSDEDVVTAATGAFATTSVALERQGRGGRTTFTARDVRMFATDGAVAGAVDPFSRSLLVLKAAHTGVAELLDEYNAAVMSLTHNELKELRVDQIGKTYAHLIDLPLATEGKRAPVTQRAAKLAAQLDAANAKVKSVHGYNKLLRERLERLQQHIVDQGFASFLVVTGHELNPDANGPYTLVQNVVHNGLPCYRGHGSFHLVTGKVDDEHNYAIHDVADADVSITGGTFHPQQADAIVSMSSFGTIENYTTDCNDYGWKETEDIDQATAGPDARAGDAHAGVQVKVHTADQSAPPADEAEAVAVDTTAAPSPTPKLAAHAKEAPPAAHAKEAPPAADAKEGEAAAKEAPPAAHTKEAPLAAHAKEAPPAADAKEGEAAAVAAPAGAAADPGEVDASKAVGLTQPVASYSIVDASQNPAGRGRAKRTFINESSTRDSKRAKKTPKVVYTKTIIEGATHKELQQAARSVGVSGKGKTAALKDRVLKACGYK